MNDNDDELYEQVVETLDGEDVTWVKRVYKRGGLTGIQLLAVILYTIRDLEDKTRDPKKIVTHWSSALTEAVKNEEIVVYDKDSFFPIKSPKGFNWVLSVRSADEFINEHGGTWTCAEQLAVLFREKFPNEKSFQEQEPAPPNKKRWSNDLLKNLWEESLLPGVTHKSLGEKYGVGRQRISSLLKEAKGKFARLHGKSSLNPKINKIK